jgi:hypothetical protein
MDPLFEKMQVFYCIDARLNQKKAYSACNTKKKIQIAKPVIVHTEIPKTNRRIKLGNRLLV